MRINIEKETLKNNNYRKVVYTTSNMQLVLMNLEPREEIGMEKHLDTSQFIRVEGGRGIAFIGKERHILSDGVAVIIPPKVKHNIIAGDEGLKLYTIYTPPQHEKGLIEKTKEEE